MSNHPNQLQEQIARANALIEQRRAAMASPADPGSSLTPLVSPAAPVPASPDTLDVSASSFDVPPVETVDGLPAETVDVSPVETQTSFPDWEQKYRTLEGKYSAEVPRMAAQIRELQVYVEQLQSFLSNATKPAAPETPTTPASPASVQVDTDALKKYISAEDLARFDPDDVKSIYGMAQAAVDRTVATVVRPQVEEIQRYVAQTAQEQYFSRLQQLVPDIAEVNVNPNFIQWLQNPDTFTGDRRHDLLATRHSKLDAGGVARIIAAWKSENKADTRPAQASTPPIERMVAPNKSRSAPAPTASTSAPTFTRSQVSEFYRDVLAGKYLGKDAEKLSLEKQFLDAATQGRLRDG